ncbi:MAG: uracil-DNA glycosylase [Chloroflexi bacterium]|nr:uracil-DNA glycosylase [Chloroflexota bacterium]
MTDNVFTADFDEIDRLINSCTLCSLGSKRTTAVPGNGSRTAELMFIGEGPGYYEDQQGLPFVGRAGQLLNEMLGAIGMRREDVFVTNMIKCRAPNNRDPLPIEIRSCGPYLDRQIELVSPKVIVTLGRYSTAKFFPDEPIGKLRGTPANWNGIIVYPLYHPAAALRNSTIRASLERDFLKLPSLLEATTPTAAPVQPPPSEPQTAQLGLLDAPPSQSADRPSEDSAAEPQDEPPSDQKQLGLF